MLVCFLRESTAHQSAYGFIWPLRRISLYILSFENLAVKPTSSVKQLKWLRDQMMTRSCFNGETQNFGFLFIYLIQRWLFFRMLGCGIRAKLLVFQEKKYCQHEALTKFSSFYFIMSCNSSLKIFIFSISSLCPKNQWCFANWARIMVIPTVILP